MYSSRDVSACRMLVLVVVVYLHGQVVLYVPKSGLARAPRESSMHGDLFFLNS